MNMEALPLTSCRDEIVPLASGQSLPVRIYQGATRHAAAPLVLHLHAGSFTGGDLGSGELVSRLLAEAGAVVVDADYPKGQGQIFPAALKSLDGLLHSLFQRRGRLASKHSPLLVAGEEAGGNLAAALALMARDQGHGRLAGQILIGPMLDPCLATASLRDAETADASCRWAQGWRAYLGECEGGDHPYASPARASRLSGVAPALVVSTEDDPMRDESLAYARALKRAGVLVQQALLPGPSGWPEALMKPLAQLSPLLPPPPWVRVLRQRLAEFLSRFLPAAGPSWQPA
ncbi:MAG: alpha/beta hydrolase [Roseateles depolymerans]|uniref:Alpha/beta hydrolase n=1 Tax=Roseateles depolymerans TaxID=76731 RepID=A0A2W5DIB4_9BURK|nr:MAG: alpha/beta hydrolase [Roseateles depolymerans]